MEKIIILEDIINVANKICELLNSNQIKAFHNTQSFLDEYKDENLIHFIEQAHFFILDFNLGDNTLLSSGIYEIILSKKKENAILCCISSYSKEFLEFKCKKISSKYNRRGAFDLYLKKDPVLISNAIKSIMIG